MYMNTLKLFEYETNLEALRPKMTEAEVLATAKSSDKLSEKEADNVASFSIAPGIDGVFIKTADACGNHKKLQFMNPVAAKNLANQILQTLSFQGFIEDEAVEVEKTSPYTIH
jgi:hypothetical protein